MFERETAEECNVCGECHVTASCPLLGRAQKVQDNSVPSRARLSVPRNLTLEDTPDGKTRVLAREDIRVGIQFGPVEAPRYRAFKGEPRFKLKIFPKKGRPTCLDTSDEYQCNWMCFVEPAANSASQNLIAYQLEQDIFFSVQKPIRCGDALLVGYAPPYGRKMAGPMEEPPPANIVQAPSAPDSSPPKRKRGRPPRATSLPRPTVIEQVEPEQTISPVELAVSHITESLGDDEAWKCSQCGQTFYESVAFARHLQDHYRPAYLKELSHRHRGTTGRKAHSRVLGGPKQDVIQQSQSCEKEDSHMDPHRSDNEPTHLFIQLEDGTIHKITSYHSSKNPGVEHTQQPVISSTSGGVSLNTLDLGNLEGNKETVVGSSEKKVEDVSHNANKDNLQDTRQELVIEEDECEMESDMDMDDDYDSCENDYAATTGSGEGLSSPEKDKGHKKLSGPGDAPKELHIAIEMVTTLPCPPAQPGDLPTLPGPSMSVLPINEGTEEILRPDTANHPTSDSSVELTALSGASQGSEGNRENLQKGVAAKYYRSIEQARLDRPRKSGKYRCDLCGKGFNQTLYLFRHIRKHTGEFTCSRCQKVFARKENMVNHICGATGTGQTEAEEFPCSECGKTFASDRLLKRHCAKHTGQYTCTECGKSYSTKEILANHACVKHPLVERYSCGVCGKAFTRHTYLMKHLPMHTGQHSCPVCGKWLRSLDSLTNHLRMCTQVQDIERSGKATCSHCHKEFTNAADFRRHQYEHTHVHRCDVCGGRFRSLTSLGAHVCQGRPVECEGCGEVFDSVASLDKHRPAHGEPQFKCESCGKEFFKEESLSKHPCVNVVDTTDTGRRKDLSLLPLVCEVCGSTFASTSSLNVHRNLHGEKRFQCDTCGKRFHRKDLLLEHHAVHGDPTFPCPTCHKLFKTKKSLDVHSMIHEGVKRFKCSVCGKEFFQKGNLQKHEETHLSDRRHRCSLCQKVFLTRESFNRHALEHTRGKIFTCGICGRSFVKEHQLRNHHRMFHTNQTYSCQYCGLCLKLRHSLKRHLRKKHPEHEAQWRNPNVLSAMLATKGGARDVSEEYTQGIDTSALDQQQQLVFESQTAQESLEESLVTTNLLGDQGAEVLLEVEGFSSEELREAIASGRAQIKQGPTPDTIEISMPYDATHNQENGVSSEEVAYASRSMELNDSPSKAVADMLGDHGAAISAISPVTEHYVVSNSTDIAQDATTEVGTLQEETQFVTQSFYATEGDGNHQQTTSLQCPQTIASDGEQFVITGQEVPEGAHIIYGGEDIEHHTVPRGAIVLDDGTILQQEEESGEPTDLLFYVLTTSESQEES